MQDQQDGEVCDWVVDNQLVVLRVVEDCQGCFVFLVEVCQVL